MREVYRQVPRRASRSLHKAAGLCLMLALGGCASALPMSPMLAEDDVTGSIPAPSAPLSSTFDAEDWRRARTALGNALDPQANGSPVAWDNPASGTKGLITPVGDAYAADDKICRACLADIKSSKLNQQLQGRGCRDKAGEWSVSDVKPWQKA